MSKTEVNQIKRLVSKNTWDILASSDAVIAGGALTSVFCNRPVNDIDVYFRNEDDFLASVFEVFDGSFSLRVTHYTDRSIMLIDKETNQEVQLIVYKFFPTVEDIFNDFDYTINMAALVCKTEELVLHNDFLKHNNQRYLQFNENTAYPLISALRVNKYIERGYTISKPQYLKLLMTVNKLSLNSWDDVKDQIGGMYGLDLNEVFSVEEEFSLGKTIEILDSLEPNFSKYENIGEVYLTTIIGKYLSSAGEDCKGRYFKWVEIDPTGEYQSRRNNQFKYAVGKVVNGGMYGIWVQGGGEIITRPNFISGIILELEPLDKDEVDNYLGNIKGDVKVLAAYTPFEFYKKFDITPWV